MFNIKGSACPLLEVLSACIGDAKFCDENFCPLVCGMDSVLESMIVRHKEAKLTELCMHVVCF